MALMRCPSCGMLLPRNVPTCPTCRQSTTQAIQDPGAATGEIGILGLPPKLTRIAGGAAWATGALLAVASLLSADEHADLGCLISAALLAIGGVLVLGGPIVLTARKWWALQNDYSRNGRARR